MLFSSLIDFYNANRQKKAGFLPEDSLVVNVCSQTLQVFWLDARVNFPCWPLTTALSEHCSVSVLQLKKKKKDQYLERS